MEWSLSQNKLLAFHRLMRTDKPIGALLLLWPTLWPPTYSAPTASRYFPTGKSRSCSPGWHRRSRMMIQCKRVYDPQESSDGYRVLVDRLWPRGIKKEALACDEWCKELTPSAELRKAFHGEAIDFAHFSQRYRQELDAHRETGLR